MLPNSVGSRVRSVRRTSLREKQLAAKADVRGEARLRETFDSAADDDMQVSNINYIQYAAENNTHRAFLEEKRA